MKATQFDKKFDSNEDITELLDLSKAKRIGLASVKRINIEFPAWMIDSLDKEAIRVGTTRQSLIKFWIADKLDHHSIVQ
jgi:hypothetical protein